MELKKNAKIAILGFGIEGRSAAAYLRSKGYTDITICDSNEKLDQEPGFPYRLGATYLDDLTDFDVIFRSPGIPFKTPEIQHVVKAHKEVTSVTKFFFDECPCPIIAVTGTKGKGTTCTLTYEMLKQSGVDARLGGNIGNSPLEFLDELKERSVAILELGHGQIEDLHVGPKIGIVLGVTVDHLDYHDSIDAYRESKHPLIANQKKSDIAIINSDYPGNQPFLKLGKGKKYKISRQRPVTGGFLSGDQLYLKTGWFKKPLVKTEGIALLGPHNVENVLPASLAASLMGAELEIIKTVIQSFQGLPHRLEVVAEKSGVKFVNDSFATTPETGIAGVNSFRTPLILLAGGSEKNADFEGWAEVVANRDYIKKIILIGDASAKRMKEELDKRNFHKLIEATDYEAAFEQLKEFATEGDTVLMSPACASFDLFENYKKRGDRFRELARAF